MKIIFVLEDFNMGGVERVTYQLLCALKEFYSQINVTVLYEQANGEYFNQYNERFPCIELCGGVFFSKKIFFSKLIDKHKPDVVVYTKGGLSKYKPLWRRNSNIKHIAIQHVPIDLPETGAIKNIIRQLGAAILYRGLDKVVCVSKGIESNLQDKLRLKGSSLTTIYNPVLDASIIKAAEQPVEYSNYFICVGRLHYQKGYDFLLDIMMSEKMLNNNTKVVILGDGEERENLQCQIIKLGLEDSVILHGATNNPYKYIKHANAILLPSRWEGLPTVLVEAAYLNTQMIAFGCRYGPQELTNNGKNGYLVEMGNLKSFSDAIRMVNAKVLKDSPSTASFTLESAVANYVQLFELLICKKS
jgi:glycosyltransferase involved in cell wall biosynthesis